MPTHDDMDPSGRGRVIRSINLKIRALQHIRSGIRALLNQDNLSSQKRVDLEFELTRIKLKIDALRNLKAAFKANEKSITPPTPTQIEEMKRKVAEISEITIRENTYRAAIRAATEMAGSLPAPNLA